MHGRGRGEHNQRVCRAYLTSKLFASASNSILSSVLVAAAPYCLPKAVVQMDVNGLTLRALVDTGSPES